MPSLVGYGTAGLTPNTAANPMTTSGTVPTMPSHEAGDLLLMFAFFNTGATTNGSITAPAGWTDFQIDFGIAADSFIGKVFYKLAASSSETYTSPSFVNATTGTSGGVGIVQVHAYRDVDTSSLPASAKGASSVTGTMVSSVDIGPIAALSIPTNNALIVVGGGRRGPAATANLLTGDGLTYTEVLDVSTTNGADAAAVIDVSTEQITSGTIQSKTFTYTTTPGSDKWGGFQFALAEVPVADNVTIDNGTLTDFVASTDEAASGHIQRMKLCYAADGTDTHVPADAGGLMVQPPLVNEVTGSITAAQATQNTPIANATVVSAVPSWGSEWQFSFAGTFTGSSSVSFDGTTDGGTTWFQIPGTAVSSGNASILRDHTASLQSLGVTAYTGRAVAFSHVRARCTTYQASDSISVRIRITSGSSVVVPGMTFPMGGVASPGASAAAAPVWVAGYDGTNIRALDLRVPGTQGAYGLTTQQMKDAGRTAMSYYATGVAAGATGVETAITLTKSSGTAATSSGVSHTPTSGKRFRITQILLATRGHATATIQSTTFSLRVNTGGAVTTSTTPVVLSARCATAAVASDWDRVDFDVPDGYEILGTATLQFGMTANATYTTNAPTWDVNILGFEY